MRILKYVVTLAMLGLCACGGADPGQEAAADAEAGQNRVLLDAAQAPLNRAREAEDISAERKSQLDEEINGAEE